jgi:excisionase family DNA binding protein
MFQDRLAYRVPEVCRMLGISKSMFYNLVSRREIMVHKLGSITLVKHEELERVVKALPPGQPPDGAVDRGG